MNIRDYASNYADSVHRRASGLLSDRSRGSTVAFVVGSERSHSSIWYSGRLALRSRLPNFLNHPAPGVIADTRHFFPILRRFFCLLRLPASSERTSERKAAIFSSSFSMEIRDAQTKTEISSILKFPFKSVIHRTAGLIIASLIREMVAESCWNVGFNRDSRPGSSKYLYPGFITARDATTCRLIDSYYGHKSRPLNFARDLPSNN